MLLPAEIAKLSVRIGENKARLSWPKMILLGVLAGMFIALAGVGATFGNVYVGKIAGALIFPTGLAMVVVAGSELFTGNNLMIIALLNKKITIRELLKNWGLVYLGNFIGAIIVAALVVFSNTTDPISETIIATASAKVSMGFMPALLKGLLCNFLVCIAVWMSFGTDSIGGKIAAVFFPVMLFVLCGFEHSIANMYYVPAGIFASAKAGLMVDGLNFWAFLLNNLLPVTIGNILGGAGIVGGLYYLIYIKKH